ncbi:MAG: hypothetical protein AB8G11_12115 [Saprospiraceae bacterium]
MVNFLLFLIIAMFCGILFLNVYFRVKVFKIYKKLVQNQVEFKPVHFLNKERLEEEILPKYPEHKEDILKFISHIRFSMSLASVLITLITAFAAVLMFMRD